MYYVKRSYDITESVKTSYSVAMKIAESKKSHCYLAESLLFPAAIEKMYERR